MNTSNRINVTSDSNVGILLLTAITQRITDWESLEAKALIKANAEPGGAEVMAVIGGVQMPIIPALEEVLERMKAQVEERAAKRALELVSGAGLNGLRDIIEQAEWQIKEALTKAGAKFGEE